MNKLTVGLATTLGVVLSVVTVRAAWKRRSTPQREAADAGETTRAEADAAVDHATAAVAHTRAAGENLVEYARREIETAELTTRNDGVETSVPQPVRRLRRVGKGWIRR